MKTSFIVNFIVFALAIGAHAVTLNFSIENSDRKSVSFPNGPARPSYDSNQQKYFESFNNVQADISILSVDTVRVIFKAPLHVKLEEGGREFFVDIPHMDFKMTPAQVRGLMAFERTQYQTVYRKSSSPQRIQDLLEALTAEGGMSSLVTERYIEKFWTYTGEISIGHLAVGEVLSGKPLEKKLHATLAEVVSYDVMTKRVTVDGTKTDVAVDGIYEGSHYKAYAMHDSVTIEAMNVIELATHFRRSQSGGILSYVDAQHRKMMGITVPAPNASDDVLIHAQQECGDLFFRVKRPRQ